MILILAVILALPTVYIINAGLKAFGWVWMALERRRFEHWLTKGA